MKLNRLLLLTLLALSPLLRAQSNPVPFVNQPLIPDTIRPGGPGFKLTVTGTGFAPGAVVNWNGSPRITTLVSSSKLTASITASDTASVGTAAITVSNPAPGGGTSSVMYFPVAYPTVTIGYTRLDTPLTSPAQSLVVGDFNGDGKPDLAVWLGGQSTYILLGNGDGTFANPLVDTSTGGRMVVGDFNGDGKLDLAVSGSQGEYLLLGNGDGTFQAQGFGYCASDGGIFAADVNKDGLLDLIVTCGSAQVFLGLPGGQLAPPLTVNTDGFTGPLTMGDFNHDGNLDLAVLFESIPGTGVLPGNGDGTFPNFSESFVDPGFGIAAADLDGDGNLDLITDAVTVWYGQRDGIFVSDKSFPAGVSPLSLALGDLNGDGKLDVGVANKSADTVSVLLGNGDGTLQAPLAYAAASGPTSIAVADFDGDGRLDLAVANSGAPSVSVFLHVPAALTPSLIAFPDQAVGTVSLPQTVTLTNTGKKVLNIKGITITGTNRNDFAQTNNCGPSLAAGASCAISVTFAPLAARTLSASISVSYGGMGSPQNVALSGTGTGAAAQLLPLALNFGTQAVGTGSLAQIATLTNVGSVDLTIGIAVTGDFQQTNTCGPHLAVGTNCTIRVRFSPLDKGTRTGTLSVTDNAPNSPQTVALSGVGTFARLSAGSVNFGNQAVGTTSQPAPITLTNKGPVALNISQIFIDGANPGDFAQTNTCGTSVPAGGSCTISVTFTPLATGSRAATLQISDDGGGSPQTVSLSGTGT